MIETRSFTERQPCGKWVEEHNGERNIYFHVNPTTRPLEKKADREDIAALGWLHVDIDPRPREDIQEERARALGLLTDNLPEGVPPPTVVVFSGGGYQGFWKLSEPFPIDGDLERAEEAKLWNMQLELLFGADNCHNVDRIMRLPGTINVPDKKKIEKGRTRMLAELISFSDISYPLSDFAKAQAVQTGEEGFDPQAEVNISSGNIERLATIDELAQYGVAERDQALCVQGNLRATEGPKDGDDSRSAWLMDACCNLHRANVPDEKIYSIITDPDFRISESVLDKGTMMEKYAKRQIARAKELVRDPRLAKLNERFAVIANIGGRCRVVEEIRDTHLERSSLTMQSFTDFKNRQMHIPVPVGKTKKGGIVYKPQGAWWLEHEKRRQYDRIVFDPSRDSVPGAYNLWKGFAFEAKPGDPTPFLNHLRDNLCCGVEEYYDYLIGWMARTVQQPASPGQVAIVLRGPKGAGKSFFAKHFGWLFGRHYIQVSNSGHLVGHFNAHMRDCLVVFADEAFFAGDRKHESVLKALVTEDLLIIEAKGVDADISPNFVHLIMASNDEWVVPAGPHERRYFILDVGIGHQQDTAYFSAIDQHMRSGGYSALLHYLLNYDLSNYEVRNVPQTDALRIQKEHTLRPEEDWWLERLLNGDLLSDGEGWPDCTPRMPLYNLYITAMKDLGVQSRRLSPRKLGEFLRKVCPDLGIFQREHLGARPQFWSLPTLKCCRERWVRVYGPTTWSTIPQRADPPERETPF